MPDLLVEIRTEELPATKVADAAAALRDGLAAKLAEAGLLDGWKPEGQPVLGTPRRLAAFLHGVKPAQEDRAERMWGPSVSAAFDKEGKPTKAGEGFARSSGVALDRMGRGEKAPGKPPSLYADRVVKGRPAAEVIAEVLPVVAANLPFKRTMRWPQSDMPFVRPIRGLVVLLGGDVVPCRVAGVDAGRTTRGHAFLAPGPISIGSADLDAYRDALRPAKVLVDMNERLRVVIEAVSRLRAEILGGRNEQAFEPGDDGLLSEVTGLVEWPSPLVGTYDERYRALPPALLVTAMAHHLRYFPVVGDDGAVLAKFISITDREPAHADSIREGNERVLRARLYDADFFFGNDRKKRLEEFRPGLAHMDFHRGLGTLLDKSERVRRIAVSLCDTLKLAAEARAQADRAAFLMKCDLLTEVVKEFTELQGQIGGHYAAKDGEGESVARAVAAQYLPAGADLIRVVQKEEVAAVLCVADKVDTLCAYFSIGEEPTGSADPFGLRRAALALLQILQKRGWALSLDRAFEAAAGQWRLSADILGRVKAFVWGRADQMARTEGYVDFVDTQGALLDRPFPEYWDRLMALKTFSTRESWSALIALVERTGNMGVRGKFTMGSLPPEAQAVANALDNVKSMPGPDRNLVLFADGYFRLLGGPVTVMFEKVLVDDPAKPEQGAAIKALLFEVFALFRDRLGDLRRLGSGARPARA